MVARWGDSERHRRKRMVLIRNTLPVWSGLSENVAVTRFDTHTNITIRASLNLPVFQHIFCHRHPRNRQTYLVIHTEVMWLRVACAYVHYSMLLFILFPDKRHDRGQPVTCLSVAGEDKTVHDMNNMNISKESKV